MIAWIGPDDGCFGWFKDQVQSITADSIYACETLNHHVIGADCARIIVAVRGRLDYPWDLVNHLHRSAIAIPWAMLVDNWWDGARRTGIGNPGHIVWPWYRWWDGWFSWLCPEHCRATENVAQLFQPVAMPADAHHAMLLNADLRPTDRARPPVLSSMVVIAGCASTASTWCECMRALEISTQVFPSTATMLERFRASEFLDCPAWILLDDTAFRSGWADQHARQLDRAIATCRQHFPGGRVVVAASMPRWSDWKLWLEAGACDLIPKPANGLALCQCVSFRTHQSTTDEVARELG